VGAHIGTGRDVENVGVVEGAHREEEVIMEQEGEVKNISNV